MNQPSDCTTFRSLLELALGGPGSAAELQPLAWHEHLLGCEACRELLTREEALEALLATLPEPGLPAELRERVLLRLKGARDDSALDRLLALDRIEPQPDLHLEVAAGARERAALEGLLDLDPQPTAPAGLAERVAAAARARADAELDHLLELDPDPVPPPDLPALDISATAAARRPALRRLRLVQAAPRYLAAAAAVLLRVVAAQRLHRLRRRDRRRLRRLVVTLRGRRRSDAIDSLPNALARDERRVRARVFHPDPRQARVPLAAQTPRR